MKSRAKTILEKILNGGESAIDDFISDRESESLFLDFKRSADNGNGKKLHMNDRINLARAISGFGNSEGGVIVWGVECREGVDCADVAQAKFPLVNPQRYRSWLESAVSASTIPPHSNVTHHSIISSSNSQEGYVVTYIPKSNHAPHQVITSGRGNFHYYIRAGSDFVPTPHAVLAGMFGRRPQPFIFHMFTSQPYEFIQSTSHLKSVMGIQIANGGLGIASDLFMSFKFISIPGKNCRLSVQPLDLTNWLVWSFLDIRFTAISKMDIRLPPDAQLQPLAITMMLAPPFEKDLKIEGLCGCGQSPSFKFIIQNNADTINRLYNDFVRNYSSGTLPDWAGVSEKYDFWNICEMSELSKEAFM